MHLSVDKDGDNDEKFLIDFEISDPNEKVDENDENKNEFIIHESVIQENKVYSDPIRHLIYHCYRQLKMMFGEDKIIVGAFVSKVQNDLMRTKTDLIKILDSNFGNLLH